MSPSASSIPSPRPTHPDPLNPHTQGALRDLNDSINRLLREKGHWERRILELGGPDYAASQAASRGAGGDDVDGSGVGPGGGGGAGAGGGGYRYFGAARDLPGVRELLAAAAPRPRRKGRGDLARAADADYHGLRDEDDGALAAAEALAEGPARAALALEWAAARAERVQTGVAAGVAGVGGGDGGGGGGDGGDGGSYVSFVPLPDDGAIERAILERKKQALLARYMSEDMIKEQERLREQDGGG